MEGEDLKARVDMQSTQIAQLTNLCIEMATTLYINNEGIYNEAYVQANQLITCLPEEANDGH